MQRIRFLTVLSHWKDVHMKKILIVDDEEDVRAAIVCLLEDTNYQILEADSGTSALDIAISEKPDLVITDVMMDSGNGFALRELLRADSRTESIKVIMMTGGAQGAGAWQSDPNDRYLLKPFNGETILNMIRLTLGEGSPEVVTRH